MESQQQHDDENSASGERKPKPVRGVGFGDIFAGGKPKLSPVDGIVTGGDKHNSNNNSINNSGSGHKAIPKKPPPPAPMPDQSNSDSSTEAAPVLPPKPSTAQLSASLNQAASHTQASSYLIKKQSPIIREQAKVIYNYEAQNSDELTIEEGDIINVINKQIEDQGWWKGELRGQIGVFPDNFVELIKVPIPQDQGYTPDLFPPRMQKPSRPPPVMMGGGPISMVMPTDKNQSLVLTPKGFSKDLETNSDIGSVGSSASFLSLNRNKFGTSSCSKPPVAAKSPMNAPQSSLTSMSKTTDSAVDNNNRDQTNSYSQSKDLNSLTSAFGSRNHLNNNTSFDSFTSYDSNSGQTPGKLNHLTAQRAKGPSSRRPPSNILAARDNISDNSLDIQHNGDMKSSNSINQSSLPNNNGNSQAAAINVNQNSQQINKSVTPPTNFKPIDLNQDHSSTKLQKSPQQQKETTPSSAVPHWMLELREKTTKKAHSDKTEKKRDSVPITSAEDSSMNSTNSFVTNAKQAESPVTSNVAPVKNSPPFNSNRDLSYQQTPTSSLTGGVKSLTSRYSGDFSFSDKVINSVNQNPTVDTIASGPNEFIQGSTFKNQSAVVNSGLVNKPISATNNRPNFPSVNSSSSRSQDAEASSLPSERSPGSGYSPHSTANRHNAPSSNNIPSTPTLHQGSLSNISNQTNSNQVKASDDMYPYSKLNSDTYGPLQNSSQNNNFSNKDTSPSDINTVVNDIHSSSAQQDFLKQQQIVANTNEIEMLKEEIRRLKEDFKKASVTTNEINSLSHQVSFIFAC